MARWWQDWGELIARQLARRWRARRGKQGEARGFQVGAALMHPPGGDQEPRARTGPREGTETDPVVPGDARGDVP
jgi:hypothetical protein